MRREVNEVPVFQFKEQTGEIEVIAEPVYLDEYSTPRDRQYVWAYKMRIANHGTETIKIIGRHWRITDGNGSVQEVFGPGVVGEQPSILPGESYEYSSFTCITTPLGMMTGTYTLHSSRHGQREVKIPTFALDSPEQTMLPN